MERRLLEAQKSAHKLWTAALESIAPISRQPDTTLPIVLEGLAEKCESSPALISETGTLSYRALVERSNQYAQWAIGQKLVVGKTVCLLMNNCPEYFAIWLGITKVGGAVALINTNLSGSSLAHCINAVDPEHVIAGVEFADRIASISRQLLPRVKFWTHGGDANGFCRIETALQSSANALLVSSDYHRPTIKDRALYIYTSGTTGVPKAASVSHFRLMQWSFWFAGMMETRSDDRMYDCLPMYHSVGGVVAIGAVLVRGGSVLLRETFSARRFWDDIVKWNCTLFQYIGELCRYLVNSPEHPLETAHSLRLCCGNGLSGSIWDMFRERFKIPRILEFYAATEGTFSLYNCEGKSGALGRVPSYLMHRFPMALVAFDKDSCAPLRDENGFCVRCRQGEIGEAIGKIVVNGRAAAGQFEGYSDPIASEHKLLRNVFADGDVWFRTGDLMRQDAEGYFYFVDRIGDTFRWKGENVSTSEVADIICRYPGVSEAAVYGVPVPGTEGRAGMAAAVVTEKFDIAHFRAYLVSNLPQYARPLFLRLANQLDVTATFKLQKNSLVSEGYDPSVTTEPIYFNNPEHDEFVRMDSDLYQHILAGQLRI